MAFVGSGGAKLILFGEHAVVHGHPALGIGLPGQLTVRWTPGPAPLELVCPAEYQPSIRLAFQRIAGCFGFGQSAGTVETASSSGPAGTSPVNRQVLSGGHLEFESNIPVSAGLGSSGAVCVAMARAVAAYAYTKASAAEAGKGQRPSFDDQGIWAAAHAGEGVFHGKPSGVDTGLALWQRLSLFTPQPGGLPSISFLPGAGVDIVYGTVPREASCAANVAAIGKAMAAGDTEVLSALAELGRLSAQAAALLVNASPASVGLGKLARSAMGILRNLGLSTPAMDAILAAGLVAGATGGKLSGGGAGGAFWLACPTSLDVPRVHAAVMVEARRLGLPGDAFTGVATI